MHPPAVGHGIRNGNTACKGEFNMCHLHPVDHRIKWACWNKKYSTTNFLYIIVVDLWPRKWGSGAMSGTWMKFFWKIKKGSRPVRPVSTLKLTFYFSLVTFQCILQYNLQKSDYKVAPGNSVQLTVWVRRAVAVNRPLLESGAHLGMWGCDGGTVEIEGPNDAVRAGLELVMEYSYLGRGDLRLYRSSGGRCIKILELRLSTLLQLHLFGCTQGGTPFVIVL